MNATILTVVVLGAGLSLATAQRPTLPPGAAQQQVLMTCTACHTLDRICAAQKSTTEWKATVDQMIRNGAVLTAAQEGQIVEYLAANFGHKKPGPATPARRSARPAAAPKNRPPA